MSLFIVFEGGDGAGKHTQAQALYRRLRRKGYPVVYTEEPGGTRLGQMLRRWLTAPQVALPSDKETAQLLLTAKAIGDEALPDTILLSTAPRAELLFFLLSRAQLVEDFIEPSLKQGKIVVCSRYAPSSVAYQGYGRDPRLLPLIEEANKIATRGLQPNLIFLLDMLPEEGLARKARKRLPTVRDHFEEQDLAFHQRVRQGYLEMARKDSERWLVIDGSLPKKEIERLVWERVEPLLP